MKVYAVTAEPYHDNSTLLDIYMSLELAESSVPGVTFRREGHYVDCGRAVSQSSEEVDGCDYLIYERELVLPPIEGR